MLVRLIYASRSAGMLSPVEVKDIVRSSQRNNAPLGVTGALMLSNGIFLQCLEGDHLVVNALYHRILLDARHREPAILSYQETDQRLYGAWAMGLLSTTEAHRALFMKYGTQPEFDPYGMRPAALELLFAEMVQLARPITA